MLRETLVLADGRNFEFMRNGIESDAAIILHAGTAQDISGWKVWLDGFAARGYSAIAIGRSGYAGSSAKPGRITVDIARDVKVSVVIWQGGQDKNVPRQHGQWLAANIANSTLHLIEDESHIGLFVNYEQEAMQSAMELLGPIG